MVLHPRTDGRTVPRADRRSVPPRVGSSREGDARVRGRDPLRPARAPPSRCRSIPPRDGFPAPRRSGRGGGATPSARGSKTWSSRATWSRARVATGRCCPRTCSRAPERRSATSATSRYAPRRSDSARRARGVYDLVVRPASIVPVPDRPAALGVTNAQRTSATLYAAASLSLVAAVLVAASTLDVRLDGYTLGAIAAYPMPLALTIAWARPRGTNDRAFDFALLHAGRSSSDRSDSLSASASSDSGGRRRPESCSSSRCSRGSWPSSPGPRPASSSRDGRGGASGTWRRRRGSRSGSFGISSCSDDGFGRRRASRALFDVEGPGAPEAIPARRDAVEAVDPPRAGR